MIFCPACESRAVPINKEHTKYRCSREICSKKFKPKNEDVL